MKLTAFICILSTWILLVQADVGSCPNGNYLFTCSTCLEAAGDWSTPSSWSGGTVGGNNDEICVACLAPNSVVTLDVNGNVSPKELGFETPCSGPLTLSLINSGGSLDRFQLKDAAADLEIPSYVTIQIGDNVKFRSEARNGGTAFLDCDFDVSSSGEIEFKSDDDVIFGTINTEGRVDTNDPVPTLASGGVVNLGSSPSSNLELSGGFSMQSGSRINAYGTVTGGSTRVTSILTGSEFHVYGSIDSGVQISLAGGTVGFLSPLSSLRSNKKCFLLFRRRLFLPCLTIFEGASRRSHPFFTVFSFVFVSHLSHCWTAFHYVSQVFMEGTSSSVSVNNAASVSSVVGVGTGSIDIGGNAPCDITVNTGADLTVSDLPNTGSITVNGGSLTFLNTITSRTITLSGGSSLDTPTMTGTSTLVVGGNVDWQGSTSNSLTLNLEANANAVVSSEGTFGSTSLNFVFGNLQDEVSGSDSEWVHEVVSYSGAVSVGGVGGVVSVNGSDACAEAVIDIVTGGGGGVSVRVPVSCIGTPTGSGGGSEGTSADESSEDETSESGDDDDGGLSPVVLVGSGVAGALIVASVVAVVIGGRNKDNDDTDGEGGKGSKAGSKSQKAPLRGGGGGGGGGKKKTTQQGLQKRGRSPSKGRGKGRGGAQKTIEDALETLSGSFSVPQLNVYVRQLLDQGKNEAALALALRVEGKAVGGPVPHYLEAIQNVGLALDACGYREAKAAVDKAARNTVKMSGRVTEGQLGGLKPVKKVKAELAPRKQRKIGRDEEDDWETATVAEVIQKTPIREYLASGDFGSDMVSLSSEQAPNI